MASKKNQEQSALNKMMREEIALREKEKSLQSELVSMAKARYKISNDAKQTQQDLTKALLESKSTEESIQSIQEAKDKLLEEAISKGKEINSHYYDRLDTQQKILEKLKQEEDVQEEILGFQKEAKDELMGSLGTLGEMLKAGTAIGAAFALLKSLTEGVSKALESTLGFAAELHHEVGLSADASAIVVSETTKAGMSLSNLRFSQEELNAAASTYIDTFGTAKGLSADLIGNVADLTKLTGDSASAIRLNQLFEATGQEASVVTDRIKEIAEKEGVAASKVIQGMAGQMDKLVGASEETLELFAQQNAELLKSGLSMDKLQSISENMLDIEGSMKAQAKARIMLQGVLTQEQMNAAGAIRQQALAFANGELNAKQFQEAIGNSLMSAEKFGTIGYKRQIAYAESIGMTVSGLTEMYQTIEANSKAQEEANLAQKGFGMASEVWASTPDFIKEATRGLIAFAAQMSIMNLMQGKGTGLSNLIPGMGGKGGGGAIQTEVPGSDPTSQASQGSGGGLKSLADGLKEMGDAKVFAGIGAVALAGPAFIIALPSIPFLLFMGLTPLKQLGPNFSGLAAGLNSMASTFMGSLALGAFAVAAGLAIASIPFLITISLLGIAASAGLSALGVGLTALGTAAASGLPFLGIALIGAMGLAMIPFAIALNVATPAIEAFGGVIVGVMGAIPPIISAIAEGFVTMMGALSMENIGALMLLGPALMLASVGMVAFGVSMAAASAASFFGGGIIDDISELAMIGPQLGMAGEGLAAITTNLSEVNGVIATLSESLSTMGSVTTPLYGVAGGLMSIAGGLVTMAGAGLLALPIFAAIGGLAAIAPVLDGLGSLFGGGGDSESSSDSGDSDMIDYDRLASVLQSQPIVLTIDGKAVQKITAVQRRQSKNARGFS